MSKLFNKTIFFKYLRRFWPVWGGYAFVMFWVLPFVTYTNNFWFTFGRSASDIEKSVKSYVLCDNIYMTIIFAIIMSMIVSLYVFGYLQQSSSVSFFHSLPVNRRTLFFTAFLAGFVMIEVPNVIMSLVACIICAVNNVNVVVECLLWCLASFVIVLFFFALMVLCMVLTGVGPFAMFVYFVFQAYYVGMEMMIEWISGRLAYGPSFSFSIPKGPLGLVVPFNFFGQLSDASVFYKSATGKLGSESPMILITGFIAACLLIAGSYLLYRIRHSESAGDFIAIKPARPVFRWGFAISFAVLLTAALMATVQTASQGSRAELIIGSVLFGTIGFLIAQMLIMKSFRVFKKSVREMLVFLGVMIVSCIVIIICSERASEYVPDPEDVRLVNVHMFGSTGYADSQTGDPDFIREITQLHKKTVENKKELERALYHEKDYGVTQEYDAEKGHVYYSGYNEITLDYFVNNRHVRRSYRIPADSTIENDIDVLMDKYSILLTFGDTRADMVSRAFVNINVNDRIDGYDSYRTLSYEVDKAYVAGLYDSCIADIKNKKMTVGNVNSSSFADLYEYGELGSENDQKRVKDNISAVIFEVERENEAGRFKTYYTVYINDKCDNVRSVTDKATIKEIRGDVITWR